MIAAPIDGYVVPPRHGPQDRVLVRSRWEYDPANPYEVRMWLKVGRDSWVEWWIGRELLIEGLDSEVGDGDVVVYPNTAIFVDIRLATSHTETFRFPSGPVRAYLDRTCEVIPLGQESQTVDWDSEIERLWRAS